MAKKSPAAVAATGPYAITTSKPEMKEFLEKRIEIGKSLLTEAETIQGLAQLQDLQARYEKWDNSNTTYLTQVFTDERKVNEYATWVGYLIREEDRSLQHQKRDLLADITEKTRRLDTILDQVDIFQVAASGASEKPTLGSTPSVSVDNKNVFLVHGHDHATRERVENLTFKLGLRPIVLDQQPNKGRTIIEKFEDHAGEASYAIVIATADDEGHPKGKPDQKKPRARQNVIGEYFWFMGRLGRGRVAVLHEVGIELPTDVSGVAYIPLDSAGLWKHTLGKELVAAGFKVDLSQL